MRRWAAAWLVLSCLLPAGHAGIDAHATAPGVAGSLSAPPGLVLGASWRERPGPTMPASVRECGSDPVQEEGTPFWPNAVAGDALAGFPLLNGTFAVLTTGNATMAGSPNLARDSGANLCSGLRGGFDATILAVQVHVPPQDNCLGFHFRFLSEEYPEFVGRGYHDAFIAELDESTWQVGPSAIDAANNFALVAGRPVNVDEASMSGINADGTTYDGATDLIWAKTPVTPGAHTLYLSILDVGDHSYDSAVFVDNLRTYSVEDPGDCFPGADYSPSIPSDWTWRPTDHVDEEVAGRDADGDGVPDREDRCPGQPDDQADMDGDGSGDACDPDADGDEAQDSQDNCAAQANPGQRDSDGDGVGDACEAGGTGHEDAPVPPGTPAARTTQHRQAPEPAALGGNEEGRPARDEPDGHEPPWMGFTMAGAVALGITGVLVLFRRSSRRG